MVGLHLDVGYAVFAQRAVPRVDLAGLAKNARQYFDASIEVLEETGFDPRGPEPESTRVRLRLELPKRGIVAHFAIVARRTKAADLARARVAEERGRAAGMATLAARCPTLWELEPEESDEVALLSLAALLASVALGPVLPPDDSTLFGVRGAMDRALRLAQKA